MSGYRLSHQAVRDLDEIFQYIADDNLIAAEDMQRQFLEKCRQLSEFPQSGQRYDYILPGLRGAVVGQYIVFYRILIQLDVIEIARVVHGARNLPTMFEP
jgi:toxin ParE1/3/4